MTAFGNPGSPGSRAPTNATVGRTSASTSSPARAVLFSPLTWILFLAGLFDGLSDNWVHALVLWAAAFVVARDKARRARALPDPSPTAMFDGPGRPSIAMVTVLVLLAVAYALVAGSFDRYTWPVTAAVVLPGLLVLAASWPGPLWPRPVPVRPPVLGSALWAAVFVAAGLWELTALLMQPNLRDGSYSHPTISFLMNTVLASPTGRSVTLLVWVALGAFLLTRCTVGSAVMAEAPGEAGHGAQGESGR